MHTAPLVTVFSMFYSFIIAVSLLYNNNINNKHVSQTETETGGCCKI